jgi:hypothetical protein
VRLARRIVLLLAAVEGTPRAFADPAFVQTGCNFDMAMATLSTTFDAGTTPGNLLVVQIAQTNPAAVMTDLSDDVGDVFTKAHADLVSDTGQLLAMSTLYAVSKGGARTVTVSFDQPVNVNLVTFEYSGVARPGGSGGDAGVGGVPGAGPVTTTVPNSLVVVYGTSSSLNGMFPGFTPQSRCHADFLGDMVAPVPGPYSAVYDSMVMDYWLVMLSVFEPELDGGVDAGAQPDAGTATSVDGGPSFEHRGLTAACGCDSANRAGFFAGLIAVLRRGPKRGPRLRR